MAKHILLVEDDRYLREGLTDLLKREGYRVSASATVTNAEALMPQHRYHLAVLDIQLPDGSGLDLCLKWREEGRQLPVLFLTAFDDEIQVVRALDGGGNDYVTKPFRMQELLSRIRVLLREPSDNQIRKQELLIDLEKLEVQKDGEMIYVTPTELKLLTTLVKNAGQIVTRQILLEKIWDSTGQFIDDNTLSVHMSRLREKIGADYITTYRGTGYKWEEKE